MRYAILLVFLFQLTALSACAQVPADQAPELKQAIPVEQPVVEPPLAPPIQPAPQPPTVQIEKPEPSEFELKHPVFSKLRPRKTWITAPARKTWDGCVWIGKKAEPIRPFLGLVADLGEAATPIVIGVLRWTGY